MGLEIGNVRRRQKIISFNLNERLNVVNDDEQNTEKDIRHKPA